MNTIRTKHVPACSDMMVQFAIRMNIIDERLTNIVRTQKSQRQLAPDVEIYPPTMGPLYVNLRQPHATSNSKILQRRSHEWRKCEQCDCLSSCLSIPTNENEIVSRRHLQENELH